jgi:hypothetical protein
VFYLSILYHKDKKLYSKISHSPVVIGHELARIFHELLSRDREDGRATWQPSRGTAGLVPRRTLTVRRRGRLRNNEHLSHLSFHS